ncbi:putative gamma-glutamyl-gamma-aminobutyrate hydrolase [Magnetospirillum sp. XM-1]|uniref:gamma-glutamyl-gamma-aminobutyrate hydrolase family protein n=1 Tax=Magnetospirillum sp. XM-1 TaxID=1663591 RepID=UPI00073DC8D1|nr:putative gamma-glutamyl-gamma-aminobutyrate hydrolase [Magnetospirillum sp. XM-1]
MTVLVGITQRVITDPRGERRDALDQRWSPFLAACGLTPLILPNHTDSALTLASSVPLAGIILTGGNDIADFGGDAKERDEAERASVAWAGKRGLSVLGICRGAQHLAYLGGGRLERATGHAGTRHPVVPSGREVNSYHDWAIVAAPSGAKCFATAADGSIEGFRLDRWAAIMWHPEREASPHPDDLALFRSLFGDMA